MTDNTMREAMIDQDGAVWEKIGGAWSLYKPAQSVPVLAEPVAWGVTKRYEDNVWFISDSRFTAQHYANQYAHRIGSEPDQVVVPLYAAPPTHSITAAELDALREKADEADELRKDAELGKCIRVKFRLMKGSTAVRFLGCLGVNEPEGGFDWSKTVLELIDAAIAQERQP